VRTQQVHMSKLYTRPLMKDGIHRYMGPSIYKGKLSESVFKTIEDIVFKRQAESVKDLLCSTTTGNDRFELNETPEHYDVLVEIMQHVSNYTQGLNTIDFRDIDELQVENIWINYQHKDEVIHPHTHEATEFSFVLYVRNPVPLADANHIYNDRSVDDPKDGMIEWRYGESMFLAPNRFLHHPEERDIVVFPGWLEHQVHPFSADVERICVAGNIYTIDR